MHFNLNNEHMKARENLNAIHFSNQTWINLIIFMCISCMKNYKEGKWHMKRYSNQNLNNEHMKARESEISHKKLVLNAKKTCSKIWFWHFCLSFLPVRCWLCACCFRVCRLHFLMSHLDHIILLMEHWLDSWMPYFIWLEVLSSCCWASIGFSVFSFLGIVIKFSLLLSLWLL
jgi:hypothetical protein